MLQMRILRVVALLAALTALPVVFGLLRGYQSPTINESVFPVLRAIEAKCMAQPSQHVTKSCLTVLEKMKACDADEVRCPIETYYCTAYKAGFEDELPELYRGARPNC